MGRGPGRPRHDDVLTPAEWRVLEQVRAGRANAEIAVRLGILVSTVRYHLGNILGKLELPDRAAMAAWDGEPRRVRAWAPLLWLLTHLGSFGRATAGALAIGGVVVAVAIIGSGGGGSDGGGASVVATAEATVGVGATDVAPELSPAERGARVASEFAASQRAAVSEEATSCFFVRYRGDESGQLVLNAATDVTLGVGHTGDCETLLWVGSSAPVPATERVAAERTAEDTIAERAERVAIAHAAAHPRYVSRGFVDACGVEGDTAPVLTTNPRMRDEARLPEFEVNEDGCIVLPDPALLDPQRPIGLALMSGLPLEACIIQYVEPGGGVTESGTASDGSIPIRITGSCGFVPEDAGGG